MDYGHIYILPEDLIYNNSPEQGGCVLRRVFIWMEKNVGVRCRHCVSLFIGRIHLQADIVGIVVG